MPTVYTATMLAVWMRMNGCRSNPVAQDTAKYASTSVIDSSSARRGTAPDSAPRANHRGRSPFTASDAPSLPNAAR